MHGQLANGRWAEMPLAEQMGNIGSEISRASRWKSKGNSARMTGAADRALELIDLSISWAQLEKNRRGHPGALYEICRLREVVCETFYGEDRYHTTPEELVKYFDRFALMNARRIAKS